MLIFDGMKLTNVATLAIKSDDSVRNFIMSHFGITRQSLWSWINSNDERLTDEKVIRFIASQLKVDSKILIES